MFGMANDCKPPDKYSVLGHSERAIGNNSRMAKSDIKQILAQNIERFNRSSQAKLADRAGMSKSHLSEVMRGISVPTIEIVAQLAEALGRQPWELLADSTATRNAALAKMILGDDAEGESVVPPKIGAARRRRRNGNPKPNDAK
jgi:transcriptional regulator with XRE-family HTH domain